MNHLHELETIVAAQAYWLFYVVSVLALAAAGYDAWRTRNWLNNFDADNLHVPFKGPKGKTCDTLKHKLGTIGRHKDHMMLSVLSKTSRLVLLGALIPSVLLGVFVYFHDRFDIAEKSFLRAGTLETVSQPSFDETVAFVSSQLLLSGFDFAEVYAPNQPAIEIDKSQKLGAVTIVVLVFRTFVQVFAVGIPAFILRALYLRYTRTKQEEELSGRLKDANC